MFIWHWHVSDNLLGEAQGGKFQGNLAVTSRASGRIDVVGRGVDNQIYYKQWSGKAWLPGLTNWTALGGDFFFDPAIVSRTKTQFDILGVGKDGIAYQKASENEKMQTKWTNLGGRFISKLHAVSSDDKHIDVFSYWDGNTWGASSPDSLSSAGGGFTNDIVAVSKAPGRIGVFGVGTDKHAYVKGFNGINLASDWYGLGGTFNSALDVVSWANGRVDVFGIGETKVMQHRFLEGSGHWTPVNGIWEMLGGSHITP